VMLSHLKQFLSMSKALFVPFSRFALKPVQTCF
jgi:hypothetical protein